jgi:hypothetical protein
MRVLITSSRMPFAVAAVRKLAEAGHEVYASDAYEVAPGSHSRYLAGHFVTASPKEATVQFTEDVQRIASENSIDVVVPAFEEAFFLASQHERLSEITRLFTAPFPSLARLHDKATFKRLTGELGLRTPETVVVRSDEELREAIERFGTYFARAAFSRGGVSLLTNSGPLAGRREVGDVHPTPESPWLVQEFVDAETVCTYSTVHEGKVTAHCIYRIPRQWQHSTGIQFVSAEGSASLEVVEKIAGALNYTGQISFDLFDEPGEPRLIECNPRATDGLLLMSAEQLAAGLLEPVHQPIVTPPGEEIQLDLAVFAEMFSEGLRGIPEGIHDLVEIPGAESGWRDSLPQLYYFLALVRTESLHWGEHQALLSALADDITWDGEPIEGLSEEDASALAALEASALDP